jgi:transposase
LIGRSEDKQISTGDRTILGAISRRGNRYLRALFVQAAWVVLIRIKDLGTVLDRSAPGDLIVA